MDSVLAFYRNIDFTTFNGSGIPALSAEALVQMGGGSCTERGVFTSLLLSALGMPVAVDFVPAWGSQNGSHSWNVLVVDDKHYAFDPFWGHNKWEHYNRLYSNTGMYDSNGQGEFRVPKVYRKTYSTHLETHCWVRIWKWRIFLHYSVILRRRMSPLIILRQPM